MGQSIFDCIREQHAKHNKIVQLFKTMDDGQPCAVRIRPLRIGDYFALGEGIPMPSGQSSEWTPEERGRYFAIIRRMLPIVVTHARHIETKPAENGGQPNHIETWIEIKVVDGTPNYDRNEMSVDDLESLGSGIGDTLVRIGNAVLSDADTGGEIETLPKEVDPETGEPFRMERGVDSDASMVVGTPPAPA